MMLNLLQLDLVAVWASFVACEYCSVHFIVVVLHFAHYCSAAKVHSLGALLAFEVMTCSPALASQWAWPPQAFEAVHCCDIPAIAAIMACVSLQQVAVHGHGAMAVDIDFGFAYHLKLLGRHGPGSSAMDNSTFTN